MAFALVCLKPDSGKLPAGRQMSYQTIMLRDDPRTVGCSPIDRQDSPRIAASLASPTMTAGIPDGPVPWRVDPLASLVGFSATELLASYLLVSMLASDLSVLLKAAQVGATAPFAALMGLALGRQP
jgi:hypothetical protein